jgi:drug/metabolite transporter (DMT)-like permease
MTAPARSLSAPTPALGILIVLGSAALFGSLGPLSRFAYDAGMDPAAFVAWRALIGFGGLAAFVAWRHRSAGVPVVRPWRLPIRDRRLLLIAACMGFSLNVTMFLAFDRITVALALLGFYTYPALVAGANIALGRERLDAPRAVALGLAVVGMLLVVVSQLDASGSIRFDAFGFGLALAAAVSQTVFVVVSRDGFPQVPAEQVMAVVLAITVVGGVALALVSAPPAAIAFPLLTPSILPLLLVTGVFAAAIPSIGFLTGIRTIGGTRAGILMLFEPVVGVALAAWLLDEALHPIQALGAAAILGAALILQRSARLEPADTVPDGPATVAPAPDPAARSAARGRP